MSTGADTSRIGWSEKNNKNYIPAEVDNQKS